ncbi:MAG: hypothetical protein ACRYFK_04505 [Janthinobacterium lividum]
MLPRITGQVAAHAAGGSRLCLRHQLSSYAWVVTVGGLGLEGYVGGRLWPRLTAAQAAGQWADLLGLALPPVVLLGVGLLPLGGVWLGVRQSRPRLLKLLQLQESTPGQPG